MGRKQKMSSCRNPDILCFILSSLSPSLSRTFRDAGFFFRGIHVSEIHFRELSRKTCDTNSPFSAVKCALKPLIPSTTGIVLQQLSVATCGLILHLVASSSFTSSSSTPPSNASSRSQWALPDLNRERQISVGTAGPQLRPRISVGTARHHKRQISVGTATPLSNGGGRPS